MNNKSIFRSVVILITIVLLASCDKDFNEIGTEIIGDDHFGFEKYTNASVIAFNQGTGAVQSNNLPVNALGLFDNTVLGKTRANFVTQLEMASVNPTFDPALFVSMDSVVLTVPYFSTRLTSVDGKSTYKLDSIYGSTPIDLKVFESGYYMTDLDPNTNFEQAQRYFSDQDNDFDSNKIGALLNNSTKTSENTAFLPSSKEIVKFKASNLLVPTIEVEARLTPRMNLHLNKDYFKTKIMNAPSGKLASNTTFKDYFRGLYFQVADAANGTYMKLDFSAGNVTMYYTEYAGYEDKDKNPATPETLITFDNDNNVNTPEVIKKDLKTFVLNMRGNQGSIVNTVNLIQQTNNTEYAGMITNGVPNQTSGDEALYVKGGADGSVALIDLFKDDLHGANGVGAPNGISDLVDIRNSGWLINEANLIFYVNKEKMANAKSGTITYEPQRIYLYDAKNKRPLIDYFTDQSTFANAKFNKSIHGGLIEREQVAGGRGIRYKLRITDHIRNLVKNDSTNVRLGLSVTDFIGNTVNSRLKQPVVNSIDRVPSASVMNQFGTILYGSNPNVPADKRLKLEIYYTKPN